MGGVFEDLLLLFDSEIDAYFLYGFVSTLLFVYWAVAATGATLLFLRFPFPPPLSRFMQLAAARGKLYPNLRRQSRGFEAFTVPQGWFLHFYVVASCVNAALLLALLATPAMRADKGLQLRTLYPLGLFAMHCLRRLYESLWVLRYNPDARMHVLGYLVGLSYYICTPWTLCLPALPAVFSTVLGRGHGFHSTQDPAELGFWPLAGVALFTIANLEQNECHRILASLAQTPRTGGAPQRQQEYHLPRGGWFERVAAPHYFFEILVYVGIFILQGPFPSEPSTPLPSLGVLPPALHSLLESAVRDPRPLLMAWLIGNLGYAARETHNWYKDKFRSEYPASRKSLVPFLF